MSYKDFDAFLTEKLGGRPTFTVGSQKFTGRSRLPWEKFSNLILSMSGEDAASPNGVENTKKFFRLVLIPADRQRFINLIEYDGADDDDDETVIAPQQVSALIDWLLEYHSGKPQTSETPSLDSPLDTGAELNGHLETQTIGLVPRD